jgi:hypothetical protein
MTVTAEPEVLPVEVTEPTPGLTEITPDGDGMSLEDVGETLMAMPAALLLGANTLMTSGATAFAIGGPVGLAGAGAVAGGGAAAAALVRRAHLAEQEKQDLAAGKTPNPKAPGQVKAARKARKEARQMARVARKASGGPVGSSRSGGLASRTGGRAGGRPSGAAGRKATGSGRHGKAGAHRPSKPTTASKSGGIPTSKTPTGKAAGKSRGALGRAAKSVGSSPAARPVRSAASKVAGSPMGKAVSARRAAGGGRSAAGRAAGGGTAGRGAGGARKGLGGAGGGLKSLGRRTAGGARRVAGTAKRAGAAGQAKLGKASHGLAGSRAGKAASGAGRRVASGARSVAGKAKRAGQVTRAGLAGARSAKGGTPRQIAAAARRAVARKQAQLAKQTGQPLTPGQKFRRKAIARALGTTAGVTTKGWRGARKTGAWGAWVVRAGHAKFHGRPIPVPPGRKPPPEPVDPTAHPPVGATVEEPRNTRPLTIRPTSEGGAAVLGNRLEELSNDMTTAATGYTPDGMLQWERDIKRLPAMLANVAQCLRAIESGAGNLPVNPAVIATLGSVAALQMSCSSAAADIHATFRAVHAAELERLENPRTNEHMWDAKANQ